MAEPIGEFLNREHQRLGELTADWGEEPRKECELWFASFEKRALEADRRLAGAVDKLIAKSEHDAGAREEMVAAAADFQGELLDAIHVFHVLVEDSLLRSFGVKGGVQ